MPPRDVARHGSRLRSELDSLVDSQRHRRPAGIDPSLILKVTMAGALLEEQWEELGLTVLSSDADRTLVLFSSSDEMEEFRRRLDAYSQGTPAGQKHPPFSGFVGAIQSISQVEARDRIGVRLREEGYSEPTNFDDDQTMVVDVEIWDLGRRELRERKLREIEAAATTAQGEVLDHYVGPSITMLRIRASGRAIKRLLDTAEIAAIDLPPQPDIATEDALSLDMGTIPTIGSVADDAPLIGVVDSGVNVSALIEDIIVGSIGVPTSLGSADEYGHGTRVAGVAVFGDLRAQLAIGQLERGTRLCSAKVINEHGGFDDRRLVPSQMREAITTLHQQHGCRLFVLSLADKYSVFDGGKVGTWAATLDELVRELDVVIVVAAGNRMPRSGARLEEGVTDYPGYLLENANRLCEPAGAANVLTVGSLAHGEGIDGQLAEHLHVQPITRLSEPSPFTRIGPGVEGSTKPDLVDYGGTLVLDAAVQRLRDGKDLPSAGMLTLHHRPVDHLFTSGSGTSYAAPRVALKASHILARLPNASANLVRALLASSAEVPSEAVDRLRGLSDDAIRRVCGHGVADVERAAFSDDGRVSLYAEDELPLDHFAVYEIPIPEQFQSVAGRRRIRVTLAFDPPVRHTRRDYAGVGMNFRLVRGCESSLIFEHFRRRTQEEGRFPDIGGRYNCDLDPGPQVRDKGTLQSAYVTFKRDVSTYGDSYHLVVRCEGGWAAGSFDRQRFAVVVELSHQASVQLYQHVRQRVAQRVRLGA